jgi:hypothetical protein
MRYRFWWLAVLLGSAVCVACAQAVPAADSFAAKPRLVVLSDIGNEPDDQMSLVRLLLYSNEIEIEALVATTSTWQKTATHAETMHSLVSGYGGVRTNLLLHAAGWPTAAELHMRVATGQAGYGMATTGAGMDSEGARALVRAADRKDERPLWVAVWGGANTLAQALIDVRASRSAAELDQFVARLRVYSISDQDDAGPWIRREFPKLMYIAQPTLPNGQASAAATWSGISGDFYYRSSDGADSALVTNEWLQTNVREKGSLGKLYPRFLFIMEGDTPSFLNLIGNGLNSYQRPDWGGWGGRYLWLQPYGETHPLWTQGGDLFTRITSQDTVRGMDDRMHTSDQATIWRWRKAYQNDFAARMDWTFKDRVHANHTPVAVVNGDATRRTLEMDAVTGRALVLDASGSHDPDAGQHLTYRWFQYNEAGAADGNVATTTIANTDAAKTTVHVDSPCTPAWLPLLPCSGKGTAHVILAITDDGSPSLTSYRRIVLHVRDPQ